MTLYNFRDAMVAVVPKTFHYVPPDDVTGNYIVWAEDGQGSGTRYADGKMLVQTLKGELHYHTATEYDPTFDAIQAALKATEATYELFSVSYDPATRYVEYVWIWEIVYA